MCSQTSTVCPKVDRRRDNHELFKQLYVDYTLSIPAVPTTRQSFRLAPPIQQCACNPSARTKGAVKVSGERLMQALARKRCCYAGHATDDGVLVIRDVVGLRQGESGEPAQGCTIYLDVMAPYSDMSGIASLYDLHSTLTP